MTAPNVYDPGTLVILPFYPVDGNGDAFDPSKVRYHYTDSQGNDVVKTYPGDTAITRNATGDYQCEVPVPYSNDSAGEWPYDAQALNSSDVVLYTVDGRFVVKRLATLE